MSTRVKYSLATVFALALVLAGVWLWLDERSDSREFDRLTARTTGEHAGAADMMARGDFDGDGSPDEAYFAKSDGRYQLVISLSGEQQPVMFELGTSALSATGVRAVPPGKYTAYCARRFARRGRRDCADSELRELIATHDAVMLFTYEAAAALLYWQDGRLLTLYWTD